MPRRLRAASAMLAAAALGLTCLPATPAQAEAGWYESSAAAFAKLNPVTQLTAATFADPPQNNKPWARWNFTPASVTIEGLEADLQDAYDHNLGGVEIGQGGVPTNEQLVAIYEKANDLGMKVSLKVASALPGGQSFSPYSDLARRTLANYRQTVQSGEALNSAVPGVSGKTGVEAGTIVAVLAYRCADDTCPTTGASTLVRDSVIDLTPLVTGTNTEGYEGGSTTGQLNWTAPSDPTGAEWLVLTFRAIPFGTTPETLNPAGTDLLTDAYDDYFAAAGVAGLVRENGGDFFVDSHASDPWGAPEELWATDMASQFQNRAGYDLIPNLAALVHTTMAGGGFGVPSPTATRYLFSDGTDDAIRSDFNRIRSDMYTEYRLQPFQDWAHTYNMRLRVQQEDGPSTSIGDQLQTSAILDRSEYESLTGSDQADTYRPMASANHMTGNTWYSTECCAVLNNSYLDTTQDTIIRMNKEFAGGVNRIVYHIRPFLDNPQSTWPGQGFSATSKVGFSGAWNRSQPYWEDVTALNDYFARSNQVLTQGDAKVDVAVYLRNYSSPSAFATPDATNRHWQDFALQDAGYTWDYLDEHLFDLPNATVTGNRLAADGPAYKALIFDQFLDPSTNTAKGTLTTKAARKILSYAQAGLPVIFVGSPIGTGGLLDDNTELAGIVSDILALSNVSQVDSEADVPAALARVGIKPDAKPAEPSSLLSVHRSDPSTATDYYWIYNQGVDSPKGDNGVYGKNPSNLYEAPEICTVTSDSTSGNNPCMKSGEAIATTVSLVGEGQPYRLDAFTGAITPITEYSREGDRVTVKVDLATDASTIIALSSKAKRFGVAAAPMGVASTNADGAQLSGSAISLTASTEGAYEAQLTNGETVIASIGSVPEAIDLTGARWQLDAQDWQPAKPFGTTGKDGAKTQKVPVSVTLDGLKAWPQIEELKFASGTGTYTTEVELPQTWDDSHGATISLGQVTDSFTLTVNGNPVPIDQISAQADISEFLKPGSNTIQVKVATTFNNRLYALDTKVAQRGIIQQYGLVGPVVVKPYRSARVETPQVETADTSVLAALVDAAEGLNGKLGGFTDDSVAALNAALAGAKDALSAQSPTQEQVAAAVESLTSALTALTVKPAVIDKAVLQQVYDAAVLLSNTDGRFTIATWQGLQAGLAAARSVLGNDAATQAEIDAALHGLNDAVAGLAAVGPIVAKVKLNQSQLRLVKGKSLQLQDGVYYTNASPAYADTVTWTSSNPKVATVTGDGVVKALKTGTATITVTTTQLDQAGRNLSASVKVTVVKKKPKAKVTKVTASVPKAMQVGQVAYITGKYTSAKATGIAVTYKSSKAGVASVDPVGRVVAHSPGKAKITVKAGKKSKTYTIKVS